MDNQKIAQEGLQSECVANILILRVFAEYKGHLPGDGNCSEDRLDQFAIDSKVQKLTSRYIDDLQEIWDAYSSITQTPLLDSIASDKPSDKENSVPLKAATNSDSEHAFSVEMQADANPSESLVSSDCEEVSDDPLQKQIGVRGAEKILADKGNGDVVNCMPMSLSDVSKSSQIPTIGSLSGGTTNGVTALKPGQVPANTVKPAVVPVAKPSFHLPNCRVGVPFSAKIEGMDKSGRQVLIEDMRFPPNLGLIFLSETQMVEGSPLLDGEFELDLQWRFFDATEKGSATCRLISNPDPKSLWKVIEPAGDLPYPKAHSDHKYLKGSGLSMVAASRRGRSHEHSGTFRDDDFFISDDPKTGWSVLVVADGAGSAKSSREGARIAVTVAGKCLVEGLAGDFGMDISKSLLSWDSDSASASKLIGDRFHYFFHGMAKSAIQAIEQEAGEQQAPVKEYATTLLAAAVKKENDKTFLATFWMGDGAIAAYGPKGKVRLMGQPDGGEFAGQTRFLDQHALNDPSFSKRVGIGRWTDISSIILMTDGVSDPYFETDNGLADPMKWDDLWKEIQPHLADAAPGSRLVDWLHFFKQGHHDDRTIALLW